MLTEILSKNRTPEPQTSMDGGVDLPTPGAPIGFESYRDEPKGVTE